MGAESKFDLKLSPAWDPDLANSSSSLQSIKQITSPTHKDVNKGEIEIVFDLIYF